MSESIENPFGLVLTGGGARGAYQAGVLQGLSEILKRRQQESDLPFRVLSGTSSGAINCSFMACATGSFEEVTQRLVTLWDQIQFADVFETNTTTMGRLSYQWAKGLGFAGLGTSAAPNHLLDTTPLLALLEREIDFSNLNENNQTILAVNATNYPTGAAITFFSDANTTEEWVRSYRLSRRTQLTAQHVLASAAIPILFPPVKIENSYFGDGALRMKSPFSPVIRLGATKVLAIGIRKPTLADDLIARISEPANEVQLSDIAGSILNSVFLDSLNSDLERLLRINQTLRYVSQEHAKKSALKEISVLTIQPSQDLGDLAKETIQHFPKTVRYLMRGIGASDKRGSELLSYLSFHPSYTQKLIEIGKQDALNREDEVVEFFSVP